PPVDELDDDAVTRVRARLESGVAHAAAGLAPGVSLEVGLPLLRRARYQPEQLGLADEPFAWKPAFVRRSLGLELVRACAQGRYRGPAHAVGPVADRAVEEWRRTGWRTYHWEPWLAGLGAGARSVVLAEAIVWATPLWATFDWAALLGTAELGAPDDRWSSAAGGPVHLKGRVEARVRPHGNRPSLVSVASGRPGDGWRDELAYLALVAALAAADRPVPSRVVGLWPECGYRLAVEIDEAALAGAVDRVVDTVAVVADVRMSATTVAVA
ncbi:MAG TPA: hypothetical protein VII96_12055, partial [Acidimicrobiales bacterium]